MLFRSKPENWLKRTRVCRGASLGAGAIILPGVTVGTYSMIGAGSVVTVDVPPHARVAGNPARLLGWVCICGQPATAAANTEPFLCPDCAATPGAG